MRKIIFILIFHLPTILSFSQEITQTIRGRIIDRDAKIPLVGANVILSGTKPLIGVSTDINGNFRLDHIPVGRIDIKLTYLGYEEKVIPNILLTSGKEVVLELDMQELLVKLDEVVVTAHKNKGEVLNEMALISSRTFSVDETKHYAGSINDPSRMVSSYAGVTNSPSGNNDIIVRGNSPRGISWRLEGVEVPNPNHFANEGATGGAISALNSDMLANSDFYTGAFAPEYGNVLSGVFDMKLRSGNNEKHEYAFGAGVIGTDMMLEGPFKANYTGSYLINYRYSSLAMLSSAGLVHFDGVPKFQDGSFKIVLPTHTAGMFSIFGLGGISHILNSLKDSIDKTSDLGDYGARLGVLGVNHTYAFNDHTYVKSSVTLSGNGNAYKEDLPNRPIPEHSEGHMYKTSFRISTMVSRKVNSQNLILTGVTFTNFGYDFLTNNFDQKLIISAR